MAIIEIEKIFKSIYKKWDISLVRVIHRLGEVLPSELSMILIVKSRHRKESFEASQYFVDELKKTVPIWKKEFFEDGTIWINDKIVE
jgi:molybdopterin synthase catalytic subunit